jgi:hypothetical protein
MKEFALLFRFPNGDPGNIPPEEFKTIAKKWQDWAGGIAAQGRMSAGGQRLDMAGKVLKPGGVITDGPFVEIREVLGSFIVVKAENLDDATTLAHGCPVLDQGGSVEIRPLFSH